MVHLVSSHHVVAAVHHLVAAVHHLVVASHLLLRQVSTSDSLVLLHKSVVGSNSSINTDCSGDGVPCTLVQSLCTFNWLTHQHLVEGCTNVCSLELADRVCGSSENKSSWQHALRLWREHLSALCSVQDHSTNSQGQNTSTEGDDVLSVVRADWKLVHDS